MSSLHAGLSLLAAMEPPKSPPAGGFSERDLAYGGAMAAIATIVLLVGGLGYRSRKVPVIGWLSTFAETISRQPGWASMPCGLAIGSLICALFGVYWDVALHVDIGRDQGAFGTPAHYFILAGLYGIVLAGFFAMCLPDKREGPTFIKITRTWHAPLGGVMMFAAGSFSLLGFPLDDQWHRLFGQDVTLWGPTHLMLIGGACMTLLAIAVLQIEVIRAMQRDGTFDREVWWVKGLRRTWWPGGMLIALSVFQMEFDLGIPQFQLVFQPMLIAFAAGVVLVAARIYVGPYAALKAVAFYLVMRGLLSLGVGGLGETAAHFPTYIVEALLVEGIALLVSVKRPLVFGTWCGAAIGTVGLAAEWGWSHIWMPIPWPADILPEVAAFGLAAALAGSLVGAYIGARLGADDGIAQLGGLRWAGLAGAVAMTAVIGFTLHTPSESTAMANVTLRDVQTGPDRTAIVTARMIPASAADGATWLTATSWQGKGLVVNRLEEIRPGVYRSTEPIPVHGDFKAIVRMHTGNALLGVPIYAPADAAVAVPAIAAPRTFTRPFVSDHKLLQREAKVHDPNVALGAYGVIALLTVLLLAMLARGLHRTRMTASPGAIERASETSRSSVLATPPAA